MASPPSTARSRKLVVLNAVFRPPSMPETRCPLIIILLSFISSLCEWNKYQQGMCPQDRDRARGFPETRKPRIRRAKSCLSRGGLRFMGQNSHSLRGIIPRSRALTLGAGVTPAQGGAEPTVGFALEM